MLLEEGVCYDQCVLLTKNRIKKRIAHCIEMAEKNLKCCQKICITLEETVEIPIADFATRKNTIRPYRILKKITANQ